MKFIRYSIYIPGITLQAIRIPYMHTRASSVITWCGVCIFQHSIRSVPPRYHVRFYPRVLRRIVWSLRSVKVENWHCTIGKAAVSGDSIKRVKPWTNIWKNETSFFRPARYVLSSYFSLLFDNMDSHIRKNLTQPFTNVKWQKNFNEKEHENLKPLAILLARMKSRMWNDRWNWQTWPKNF